MTKMNWTDVQASAALIAGVVSLLTSIIAAVVTMRASASRAVVDRELAGLKRQFDEELAEKKARLDNKAVFAAEGAAMTFLMYEGFPSRSFHFIRHRLRGFSDMELRQILVRAGAVQFTGTAGEERWGLWDRNLHLVRRTDKEEADLGQAPPDKGSDEHDESSGRSPPSAGAELS